MTELPDLVASSLEHTIGDEEVEGYAVHRVSTTIQAGSDAAIRHVGRAETRGLGIRIIRDGRLGYASTSDLDPAAIQLTVQRARANAAASDVDEAQQLPEPQSTVEADTFLQPSLNGTPLAEKISVIEELSRRVVSLDRRVSAIDTAEYRDEVKSVAVASTRGVGVYQRTGYVELWADALGEDAHGRGSDYAYQFARALGDCDIESLAATAVERTLRLLGPVTGYRSELPVVFDPSVVGDFLAAIGKGLSGGPVSSGRTPFADKEQATVGAACVHLVDDGRSPSSSGAATYDDEGVPRRTTQLIESGVLVGALHSTVTARAAGSQTASTGNARRATHKSVPRAAATCLVLEPTVSHADLMSGLDQAIYIQQLSGAGVGINAVTGRVDVGGVGWLSRNGQFAGRVNVVSMATDLLSFLSAIQSVGDDTAPSPFSPTLANTVLCGGKLVATGSSS